jgi:predicted RNA-binding protein
MCLSTAYLNEKKEENIAARYVAQVRVDGNELVLTDVMGYETRIPGILQSADLTGGTLIIGAKPDVVRSHS